MVDLLLILSVAITVSVTVKETLRGRKEIKELKEFIEKMESSAFKSYQDLDKSMEQTKRDVEAIAGAINVYSKAVGGNVEQKVKENVDLFSEWINGEDVDA